MTPQLQMAIKLLQLSTLELSNVIQQELEQNPALEELQEAQLDEKADGPDDNTDTADADSLKEVTIDEKVDEDFDWSNYFDDFSTPGKVQYESEEKDTPKYEAFIAQKESLEQHLLWQLLMTSPEEENERIGSLIIGNLNKDGYLDVTADEIAETSGTSIEKVEALLALLQTFDPIGVCARNLSECLLLQARHDGLDTPILVSIVTHHIKNLENKNYNAICKALKVNLKDVIATVSLIKGLDPRPGRQFSEGEPQYINPDIFVYKVDDEFIIVLNDDGLPKLRVNSYFKSALAKGQKISSQTKDYIHEKLNSANWLIRSIHQRQKTIYRVMESIIKFQRPFFEKGVAHLSPMVLRDVAQDISMHESTISRVTTNKYAYTPQGIFELKFFFNSSISQEYGEAVASTCVQEIIKKIIEDEDQKRPYSDQKIAEILSEQENIKIARRTVAKYREMLGVLPSNKRKQF